MKKRTRRLLGALAVAAGAFGAAGAFFSKKRNMGLKKRRSGIDDVWARPGMSVTFRAELMPGREPDDRTYRIKEILPSGRVLLDGVEGEHTEGEFERIQ